MIRRFFGLEELGTSIRREVVAGLTTFVTMAYIIIVNPAILEAAGIPRGPSMVATILSAFVGTFLMGVYAKRPFAIAPYMGENAFVVTVVTVLGYSWQTALGAIFIGGVAFTLLTLFKARAWLARAIPEGLKVAFACGIGLFLAFIGLNSTGIVSIHMPASPLKVGDLGDFGVLLAVAGFVIISILLILRVRGAILIGILAVAAAAFLSGTAPLPERIVSLPPSMSDIFLKLDIMGALTWGFFSVILTVFVMDFVDTMGTLIGLSYRANLMDESGNLPEMEKPMLCDALATVAGALFGTTTTGTYLESASGIEEGGRSGLTAVVVSILFLLSLFFAPLFTSIPACAYGPALVIVGMLMLSPIRRLRFDDMTEVIPAFAVIAMMSFTFNLGVGMTAGFVLYPLLKLASGRWREIPAGLWILGGLSLLFFIFYPYH
ncbi:NCS2 family permease [Candidatus Fermentibacterales bacterium]|nr:NCS2 family permease [Candidatus Fermentibacterales bacterium]